ncbi:hypothetical protein DVH24_016466 [Malus domestica]|uniref:Thioredoxin domain-containing protein n=1 Tax=Malus domestica TaxID=3750 RepID=A0A498HTQ0_MALDO|nr:hypothetical protein DVH24_016466 [Malus domestica]
MARNLGVLVRQLLPNSNRVKNHTMETLILAPSSQPKPFSNCFNSPNPRFLHSGSGSATTPSFSATFCFLLFIFCTTRFGSKGSEIPSRSRICSLYSEARYRQVMFELEGALVSPVLQDLIVRFPHVKAYKIDASKEDSDYAIRTLDVRAVPAVAFIKDGEWVSNCVGANIAQLKYTFEALYGEHPIERPPYLDRIHV